MKKNSNFLPFHVPLIDKDEVSEVVDTLQSNWTTTGPKVKQFEKEFAAYVGSKYAVAVNSCTAALHLSLEAIGINDGDEVITTPMTFAATAEVIRYFNAKPVFIDIDPVAMNIDAEGIAQYLSSLGAGKRALPKAIIPVHYGGYPCDMDRIVDLAEKYNLRIIEDAAHTPPAAYKGRTIGSIGDMTCFSFYATKNISTGEGGMVTTDNKDWADRMRVMSLHGISKDAWNRYTSEGSWYYEIVAPGFKYNLTDIAAALGIVQLRKSDIMWKRRQEIAMKYNDAFSELIEIEPPLFGNAGAQDSDDQTEEMQHSWHLYVIKLRTEELSIDRSRFVEELKERGIGTSVHFIPLHIHPYYRKTYGFRPEDFPVAYETYKRIVSLPVYPKMTDGDVQRVIDSVMDIVSMYRK